MERIFDLLLGSFDFGYSFSVNILTYLIIKLIDNLNGDKQVPTYMKRIIAVICGIILGTIMGLTEGFSMIIVYSFILSLVSWDAIFKPLLKHYKQLDYFKDGSLSGLE
ncbi:hypothetical protein [Lachnospira sp.]|jgi:uncharacterized membrane-anchored protein|uniref:hypothetical protein n=1 Tax=Lachnospira sp. TaxID=2049031 RepID=UPI00257B57D3|nr:hypothetical protein [Lachnospira sp.]